MDKQTAEVYDVMIVGAGPAGLSAAMILGRCRRKVAVVDSGTQRNAVSKAMHGFLSRDGIPPIEFLALVREEIKKYECITFRASKVAAILPGEFFTSELVSGEKILSKKVLLATGMADELPDIPGFKEFFGKSIFLCPYCDAWECKDEPIAVYAKQERGPQFVLALTRWSRDLVLLSDGPAKIKSDERAKMEKYGIPVIEKKIARLEGNGNLERIIFKDGSVLNRRVFFFNTGKSQKSSLALKLGCRFTRKGGIRTDELQATDIPGIYAAGDACDGVKFAVVAAAQGATAGFALNNELLDSEM